MSSTHVEAPEGVRNTVLVLGLWVCAGVVSIPFALALNFLDLKSTPSITGSAVQIHVIGGLPFVPGALLVGVASAFLLRGPFAGRWCSALAVLIALHDASFLLRGWRWFSREDVIGLILVMALQIGSVMGTFVLTHRFRSGRVPNVA